MGAMSDGRWLDSSARRSIDNVRERASIYRVSLKNPVFDLRSITPIGDAHCTRARRRAMRAFDLSASNETKQANSMIFIRLHKTLN